MSLNHFFYTLCLPVFIATLQLGHAEEFQALQDLFQSETVFPQGAGETQITLSPRFSFVRDGTRVELPLGIEYGITDAFQIGAEWDSFVRNRPSGTPAAQGIGDVEIAARYSWMNIAQSNAHVALGLALALPTGDKSRDLGEGHVTVTPSAVLAFDIRRWPGAQALANLGVEIGARHAPWFLNFGFFVPIHQITATMEWNLTESGDDYATPGLIWRFAEGFEAGVGVPIGLNAGSDRYRVIAMFTHEFGGE